MSKRRHFSSLLFFSVSVVAVLVDLALLRAVKYSSFTPVYAFGLLCGVFYPRRLKQSQGAQPCRAQSGKAGRTHSGRRKVGAAQAS